MSSWCQSTFAAKTNLSVVHRDGNTWYHWPWSGIGHTRTVLVVISAQCECQHGASVKSICFWPCKANWREPMEWGLIWCQTEYLDEAACMDMLCVFVCVHVLDPVLQLMVFMCILVRFHTESQVWVTVAGQNAKIGQWADFAEWKKKRLLLLWLISKTAVMWPHIHMSNLHFVQSC